MLTTDIVTPLPLLGGTLGFRYHRASAPHTRLLILELIRARACTHVRTMASNLPTTGVARVLFFYNAAFPPMAFVTLIYVGLADAVFAINHHIGKRMHPRLRNVTRLGYVTLNAAMSAILGFALWTNCGTDDACADQPLYRRTCLLTASIALFVIGAMRVADRIFVPMLSVYELLPPPHAGYETWLRARVLHGIALCVLLMCMAEAEVLGLVLMLAITGRRALAQAPSVGTLYIAMLRLYALLHTSWVLNDDCAEATTKRMPVAVLATLLVV